MKRAWNLALGVAATSIGLVGSGAIVPAVAANAVDCTAYNVFSAAASAAGLQAFSATSTLLPINGADAGLPTAQAHIGSLSGSASFAGAPYSEAVAGNLGLAGHSPNDVPVFAVSKYPTDPKIDKQTGTFALHAATEAESAESSVTGGGPSAAPVGAGQVTTAAHASCMDGATLVAVGDNAVDAVDVAGVLHIGRVHSHAEAQLQPTGLPLLKGDMELEGVTVLGQQAAITDKGVVAAGTTTPLPGASPITSELEQAGIRVRYVAAVQDQQHGDVVAPGLEITVTAKEPSVTPYPVVTTLTLGQAFASVSKSGDLPSGSFADTTPPFDAGVATATPPGTTPAQALAQIGSGPAAPLAPQVSQAGPAAGHPGVALRLVRTAFRPWSIERAYVAMAIAMAVLLFTTIGAQKVAVRIR